MNPFEGKSLTELLDGVPGYTDMELDALCAAVCGDLFVQQRDCDAVLYDAWWDSYLPFETQWGICPDYTTDCREAGRLLVKYRLNVSWIYDLIDSSKEFLCVQKALAPDIPIVNCRVQKDLDPLHLICRAITSTAVIAALTEMIKEGE